MNNRIPIELVVNGERHTLEVLPYDTLLNVLRDDLGLKGTKPNCEEGECGACTVLIDDQAVNSCLLLAVRAQGGEITTIEGLAKEEELNELQEAYIQHGGIQCGYCTPGFVVAAEGLLRANPHPTDDEIIAALSGNICRCTGYTNIMRSVRAVIDGGGRS
jgi:carbon-monoxide dehydrogenase small subunit